MRRTRKAVRPDLSTQRNFASSRYEIAENGVLFTMELEHTEMLKSWWKSNPARMLGDWYKSLDKAAKILVPKSPVK